MRILVCGDRDWTNRELIAEVLVSIPFDTLIEGEARGADMLAREVAEEFSYSVEAGSILPFPADWNKYGKAAGPIRNSQMLREGKPALAVAFHNHIEESRGTADMLCKAEDAGVPYCLIEEES